MHLRNGSKFGEGKVAALKIQAMKNGKFKMTMISHVDNRR